LIQVFGEDILDENKLINRKILGKKVFEKPYELKKLTDIVWPEISKLLIEESEILFDKFNQKVIFVEAALLIEANWYKNMNEVWVCWIPENDVNNFF
jgi:dephospho-CoA kinase